MNIGFVAVETFVTSEKYKEWSKLYHVKEVVSFDCALCPGILKKFNWKDYEYLHGNKFFYDIINDLDWLIENTKNFEDKQILAVIREPELDCKNYNFDERFKFYGYDLVEDDTRISALTNCGGFNKAFLPCDLSNYGLIENYSRAREIQLLLSEKYPYEDHAQCALWAIWRMETE